MLTLFWSERLQPGKFPGMAAILPWVIQTGRSATGQIQGLEPESRPSAAGDRKCMAD
jgi:hypothetical protein